MAAPRRKKKSEQLKRRITLFMLEILVHIIVVKEPNGVSFCYYESFALQIKPYCF